MKRHGVVDDMFLLLLLACLVCGGGGQEEEEDGPRPCTDRGLGIANGRYHIDVSLSSPTPATTPTPASNPPSSGPSSPSYSSPAVPEPTAATHPTYTFLTYECVDGYHLEGEAEVYCMEDGRWNAQPPRCVPYEGCPPLAAPQNGTILHQGSTATFTCDRCYTLEGAREMTCHKGQWYPGVSPSCKENTCWTPEIPQHGYLLQGHKESYSCDEEVDYACGEGYTLLGNPTRACTERETWSGRAPRCRN